MGWTDFEEIKERNNYIGHLIKDCPGSILGTRAFQSCEVVFEDCAIPKENLLGGEEGKGITSILKFFDLCG